MVTGGDGGSQRPSLAYAWFVVAVLMVTYVFSFVDRQILSLLVGPIRSDLDITDTQMSLLMGFTFAIFYTICGIPLARIADHGSRRGLIAAGLILWSFMTALCGTAARYGQLLLYRIGVGVGEAALSPAAYSLIADYFPPERRATAISVYSMGIYIGSGIAFLVGGAVIQFAQTHGMVDLPVLGATRPWQVVFLMLGAAGIAFAGVLALIREPARTGALAGVQVPLREVAAYIGHNRRTMLCHNIGFGLLSLASYGAANWIPSFFVRVHHWEVPKVGLVFGLMTVVFGSAGIVFGGRLADSMRRRGVTDASLRVGLYAAIATIPIGFIYLLVPDGNLAAIALAPVTFTMAMPFGVAPAAIQEIMPNRMRAQASSIYLFTVNLIGLGCGPTAVALVTDYVFHDDNAVGYSLLLVGSIAGTLAIVFLSLGLKPYRETLARVRNLAAVADA
jgi:MFS family permease